MTWLLLAFLCALSEACKDIASKKGLRDIKPIHVTWAFFAIGTVLVTPLAVLNWPESFHQTFWLCLFSHATLYGVSVYLYMLAISKGKLSITVPLVMFTPLFMLIESPLIQGTTPSTLGILGVLLIVLGSFFLNIGKISEGIFEPIRALVHNVGSRIMLCVAFLWSLTAYIDKVAVLHVPPLIWGFAEYLLITVTLTVFLFFKKDFPFSSFKSHRKILTLLGFWNFIQLVTYVLAMKYGNPIFVLSIKRTSVLMVIVYSWLKHNEENFRVKLLGSVVMLGGVILISLS